MREFTEERLLAFLEGTMAAVERAELLDVLDADPKLSARVRAAAAGLETMRVLMDDGGPAIAETAAPIPDLLSGGASDHTGRRISPWWIAVAAIVTLALSVPITWRAATSPAFSPSGIARDDGDPAEARPSAGGIGNGAPIEPEPTYLLVLHGTWPDRDTVTPEEQQRRAREYWSWTTDLAEEGTLIAAGDLRWEPGERLGPEGVAVQVANTEVGAPMYVVGILALRTGSYEEALSIAEQCPHLRYGGQVSVRRVGAGFVTVPGMGDW